MQQLNELNDAWALMFPSVAVPSDVQWTVWRLAYSDTIVRKGLAELGKKYMKLNGSMDTDHMLRFASAIMNRLSHESHAPWAKKGKSQ